MAAKKTATKKASQKTFIQKIGEQAVHLKEEIIAGKDHLADIAGDAIDSVKSSLKNITHKKKAAKKAKAKKSVVKRSKSAPKKAVKKVAKKAPAKKSAIKKNVKKPARKR